ncbi:MAG: LptF/LptG family permease [Planctomycetaceae bacterium]|nr:LptF/LptG family permease [Planctomycetaceae bacterium]
MGKTFDRYLLHRFLVLFVGFFAASMGLFAVIDGFTNLDEFQQKAGADGSAALLSFMVRNYAIHSFRVFDLIGPTLATMTVVSVLALMIRHGEINPLLAAGVPTYRLSYPLLLGIGVVHGLLLINQELVVPRFAAHFTGRHATDGGDAQEVIPARDTARGILLISGRELIPSSEVLRHAEFRLDDPMVHGFVSLQAAEAQYERSIGPGRPAGWLLKSPHPRFEDLRLTEAGRELVFLRPNGEDVFLTTDVSFDQLLSKGAGFRYITTPDLVARVRRPVSGAPVRRAQVMHLHSRLTRPLLNVVGLFLAIPLIVRRESRSLVTSVAISMAALAVIVALAEGCQLLGGKAALLSAENATWIPLIVGGGLCAWLSPRVQT